MPASLGTMCFVMWCDGGSCAVAYVITKYAFPKLVSDPTNPPSWILLLETQTLFIIGMITGTILFSYAASLMTAIRALPSQLSTYNIDQCECYCCSNDHKDLSGRTIQCDHALVFNTIWIGTRTPMSSGRKSSMSKCVGTSPRWCNQLCQVHLQKWSLPLG